VHWCPDRYANANAFVFNAMVAVTHMRDADSCGKQQNSRAASHEWRVVVDREFAQANCRKKRARKKSLFAARELN
jgi:hypothetical protein